MSIFGGVLSLYNIRFHTHICQILFSCTYLVEYVLFHIFGSWIHIFGYTYWVLHIWMHIFGLVYLIAIKRISSSSTDSPADCLETHISPAVQHRIGALYNVYIVYYILYTIGYYTYLYPDISNPTPSNYIHP